MENKKYDVFISYSSKDTDVAFTLCEALENEGLICWIAPRNVSTGHYASSIVKGVEASKVFVLVFSENSNSSIPVINEIDLAMGSKLPLIPIRIEEILPTGAMKFYVTATNWFDVLKPKSIDDFREFVSVIKQSLGASESMDSLYPIKPPKVKNFLIFISFLMIIIPLSYIFLINKVEYPKNKNIYKENNILIFDASSQKNLHKKVRKKILSKYPNSKISLQSNWVNKFIMDKSLIFYQGESNKEFAKNVSEWLPSEQIIKDYKANPKGFFGFSKNRDLIIFAGEDMLLLQSK